MGQDLEEPSDKTAAPRQAPAPATAPPGPAPAAGQAAPDAPKLGPRARALAAAAAQGLPPPPLPRPPQPAAPPPPSAPPGPAAVAAPAPRVAAVPLSADAGARAFSGAGPARVRRRHWGLLASFLIIVVAPVCAAVWYLWTIALPQYDSRIGFSVQREEMNSAIQILGGITELSGNATSDTDILFKFIQSRELVRKLDDRLDLVGIYTRPEDPLFSLPPDPTIEDLDDHWDRKVDVFYDTASRLIEVRALAFTPEDAQAITREIFAESTQMLNDLSAIAREDGTRYAREELDKAQERLKLARQALTAFRIKSQIVDPAADVQGRMGLLNNLLAQQAAALIDLDLLASNTSTSDPRYVQAQKRVEVIDTRIRAERARFGDNPAEEDERYADLVAEFEALSVDLEFAQQAYLSSLAAFDASVAEAQRKSRYLATYLAPTLAERDLFPQRPLILGLFAGFLFSVWLIAVIVFYSLRDRR